LYRRGDVRVTIPLLSRKERLHPKVFHVVEHVIRPTADVVLIDICYTASDETFYVGGASRYSPYYQANSLEELRTKLELDGWSGGGLIGDAYGPPLPAWHRDGYSGGHWIGGRLVNPTKNK
jgi:hypothetical protein